MVRDASFLMLLAAVLLGIFTFGFLLSKPKLTGANKEIATWIERLGFFLFGMCIMIMISRGMLWESILIVTAALVPWTKLIGRIASMFQRVFRRPRGLG